MSIGQPLLFSAASAKVNLRGEVIFCKPLNDNVF